jgi:glycosyltransferase involved in cell wall biosynthesis
MSVAVVVPSYNRPNWLGEALQSIVGAAQIVVADDGSEFDPWEVAQKMGVRIDLVRNMPRPVEERVRVPRAGALFNRAIRIARHPVIAYLCDDDLFAPEWLPTVDQFFTARPQAHMCRGEWLILGTNESAFRPPNEFVLTAGNFAHRLSCATSEGCWWSEESETSHDGWFLSSYLERHDQPPTGETVPHLGVVAGYRREHPYNMLAATTEDATYDREKAVALLSRGLME